MFTIIQNNSSHDIPYELNIYHQTDLNYLQKAEFKKKLDVWVPHELCVKNKMDRLNICGTLLKRNEIESFLKRIITGDEKWVKYENIVRKRLWKKRDERPQTPSKPGLTGSKIMLCVWWNWKGIVHYELLWLGETINSVLHCEQLERLRRAIERKWPILINRKGVIFHYDNTRPYTSLMTRQLGFDSKIKIAWLGSFDASTV